MMLSLISAPRYPTTSSGQEEELMVLVARSLINALPHPHRRATSTSSSSSSSTSSYASFTMSAFDSDSEVDEKAPLLTRLPPAAKTVGKTARGGYGSSLLKRTSKSERNRIALKKSISRPIPHHDSSEKSTFEEMKISKQVEMEQSIGSTYSTQTWTEDENEWVPFEFDAHDQQTQSKQQSEEKVIRRDSVKSFASSERCYGFF